MQIKSINEKLSVTGQVLPADIDELASQGFKSLICNRPDGESADQPTFVEIEAAAKAAGLKARHIPVVSGQITNADVLTFKSAIKDLPGPVLAFCRSGARSTLLWDMSQNLSDVRSHGTDCVT
jgi:sulfide:quinone oxidoreductase